MSLERKRFGGGGRHGRDFSGVEHTQRMIDQREGLAWIEFLSEADPNDVPIAEPSYCYLDSWLLLLATNAVV